MPHCPHPRVAPAIAPSQRAASPRQTVRRTASALGLLACTWAAPAVRAAEPALPDAPTRAAAHAETLAKARAQVASLKPRAAAVAASAPKASAATSNVSVKAKAAAAKAPAVRSDDAPDVVTYGRRDDVVAFAADLAARRGLDRAWVEAALAQARFLPSVAKAIMPPPTGTAKNWAAYRARFVEPVRIRAGAAFWRQNEAAFTRAEATYGVPAEIVAGIIGVETLYGQHMGNFRVIDALATLAFDFPAGRSDRSAFFRDELEQLLVLSQQQGASPGAIRGSYAGALGMGQFMPSSVVKYAVDFDGDGRIDLSNSATDVIGSVARYLADFGWQRGLPTHFAVLPPTDTAERALLLAPDILPSFSAAQFTEHGAQLDAAGLAHTGKLALVELQMGDAAPTYVAGTANFYAVTRYNWSSYYALAVIELGQAVKRAR
jgi:membrane-bound lytic murein transglycosylase B